MGNSGPFGLLFISFLIMTKLMEFFGEEKSP